MTARASAPGSRKSTGAPSPLGSTLTEAKNSRTTTGMTIVTRTFSPRRAVSRSSIRGLGRRSRPAATAAGSCDPPRDRGRRARGRRPRGCRRSCAARRSSRSAAAHQPASAATSAGSGRASAPAVEVIPSPVAVRDDRRPGPDGAERASCSPAISSAPSARSRRKRSRGGGPAASPGGRPGRHDAAAVEDADPVGQPLDVGQVVAGQQDRGARVAQVGDDRPGRGPRLRVHPGRRLVEDDDLRPSDEREGEPESLALAARQPPVAACRATVRRPTRSSSSSGIARVGVEARRTGAGSRGAGRAGRCRRPGASARPVPGAPARRSPGPSPRTRARPPSARR